MMKDGVIMEGALFLILLVIIGIVIYFIPTIVALNKKHVNTTPIILVNVLLGWSLIGWVVALVWAFKKPENING